MLAVSAGLCRHVLCFRTVWESTFAAMRPGGGGAVGGGGGRVSGPFAEWRAPFGALSAANWIAMNQSAHLWSRSALRREDVDLALLYDGFTFNAISWLKGLGFCGFGEAQDWLDGGRRPNRRGHLGRGHAVGRAAAATGRRLMPGPGRGRRP